MARSQYPIKRKASFRPARKSRNTKARISQTPEPIRVLFFDLGNVLVRFNPYSVVRAVAGHIGRHPIYIARVLLAQGLLESLDRGQVTARDVYHLLRKELGFQENFTEFKRVWCGHFTLERETAELLGRVARTHRVYLLSNTNALHYEFIRGSFAFTRLAHGAILSYRLGMRKPDAEIYLAALKLAKVRPSQAFFVDDIAENVEGARRVGIRAWRYTGPEDLKRQLISLGVLA